VISYAKLDVDAEVGSLTLNFLNKKEHDPVSRGQRFLFLNLPIVDHRWMLKLRRHIGEKRSSNCRYKTIFIEVLVLGREIGMSHNVMRHIENRTVK
jgi:hypothetical protein